MTLECLTRGANIALIRNKEWIETLATKDEKKNVQDVLSQIKTIVERGTDKPALEDNLGRSPFAIGLAALFLNPFVKSPVTVGISGEWGMGKSSVMLQTESNLLKATAQLAFTKSFQKDGLHGAGESELSIIGKGKRRKIPNAIDSERSDGPIIIDSIGMSIKRVLIFTAKILNWKEQISKTILKTSKKQAKEQDLKNPSKATYTLVWSRFHKFWSTLRALWEESAPENLSKFNELLEEKYELKYHQILKSLAVIDRRDMFKQEEASGPRNQTVGEMQWEEYSLQGTTPSILTVQYNAWHYRNETEAWAGLAVEITKELEATMTVAHKLRTSWIYNWKNRRDIICLKVIFPFILALLAAIFLSIIVWLVFGTVHNKDLKKIKYGGLPASMIVATWGIGKSVISFVKPISSQVVDYICLPDHSQKLGYYQQVIDDIKFLKEHLCYKRSLKWEVFAFMWCCITWSWDENYVSGTKIPKMPPASGKNLRMIVFVDDLDRCEENVILQVLSAVNLVLAACEINIILSMENSMIERAILRKHGNNKSKDNKELAEKYLRKIVQLPLHLPEPSHSESKDFLKRQLGMWSTDPKKHTSHGRRKANLKFETVRPTPNKFTQGSKGRKEYFKECVAKLQGDLRCSDTHMAQQQEQTEQQETEEKAGEYIIQIHNDLCNQKAPELKKVRLRYLDPALRKQREGSKGKPSLMDDLSLIISAMLIPKYTPGERNAFDFLHTQCTRSKKLPREWKCFMAYHRLAWNILTLTFHHEDVNPVEGWQVQLIAWIFVCWEWRDLITVLIKKWTKLKVLRDWKAEEGPSLREIVEHYIDEKWPADKKSATEKEDDATEKTEKSENFHGDKNSATKKEDDSTVSKVPEDNKGESSVQQGRRSGDNSTDCLNEDVDDNSRSSTEEVEKTSGNLPEKNKTPISSEEDTERNDYLKERKVREEMREALKKVQEEMTEALRKVQEDIRQDMREALRKVQEDTREALRKVLKEQEQDDKRESSTFKENSTIIRKVLMEEEDKEGESSLQLYTMVEDTRKTQKEKDEEEREEWFKLRDALRRYNVSMDGIQAFQKFRFYCQPGHLPWPLPKQA
ncbi:hypothetical protein SUGI_0444880 [Cryptomeria japonica]|nr:hypothetical protein SUGI_0444880 [Cryptomeria japonica]